MLRKRILSFGLRAEIFIAGPTSQFDLHPQETCEMGFS